MLHPSTITMTTVPFIEWGTIGINFEPVHLSGHNKMVQIWDMATQVCKSNQVKDNFLQNLKTYIWSAGQYISWLYVFCFFGTIRHTRRMWRKFPTEIQAKYCWYLKLFKSVNRGHTEITTGWLAVNGTTTKCCGFWATSQMSQSTKSDGARMRVKRLQSALCFCSRNIYWKIKTLMLDTLWECRLQMGDC